MKFRPYLLLLLALALAVTAAACGSDDSDDTEKSDAPKLSEAEQEDRDNKQKAVDEAEKAFEDKPEDAGACRNVAMAWVSLASPASPTDPKDTVELPDDRDESLDKAIVTLEKCVDIDESDRDIRQMLASTYMATNQYDKATPLLEKLATSARGDARANAYYAWGLAAQNAQQYPDAIKAWTVFVGASPKNDPRVKQVRQSIAALRLAAKNPPAAATTPAAGTEEAPTTTEGDDEAASDEATSSDEEAAEKSTDSEDSKEG